MPYDGNTDYMTPDAVWAALAALQAAHPGDSQVLDMALIPWGGGVKPRYLEITKGLVPKDLRVLITGGTHAREMAPPDLLVSLAQDLLDAYAASSAVTIKGYTLPAANVEKIVATLDIFIAPLVNPVGRLYAMNFDPMWRKNRRPLITAGAAGPGVPGAVGVDINRNFDILWDFHHLYDRDPKVQNSLEALSSTDPYNKQTFKGVQCIE